MSTPARGMSIKLDTAAVMSLFPEGSTARLELQQAVINEVARKVCDRDVRAISNALSEVAKTEVRVAMAKAGVTTAPYASGLTLSDAAKANIALVAKAAVDDAVRDKVREAAADAQGAMTRTLKERLDSGLRAELAALAKAALREALK